VESPEILSQTKDKVEDDNAISDTPRSFPDETVNTIADDAYDSTVDAVSGEPAAADTNDMEDSDNNEDNTGASIETDTSEDMSTRSSDATTVSTVFTAEDSESTASTPVPVTVVSIQELDDTTVVVTTARPATGEDEMSTMQGMDGGLHEFDCEEMLENELETAADQIPLSCMQMDGQERRRVTIVINKSQVDPSLVFAKNVKLVVKDFMVMDINGASQVR